MRILKKVTNNYNKIKNKIIFSKTYKKHEMKKYVKKSKYFQKKWYINTYPEVAKEKMKPYEHYYNIGYKKGYNPSVKFDTNQYLEKNPDVKMCPLFHYEKYGKHEGRKAFFVDKQYDHNYKKRKIRRFVKRKISNLINIKRIKKNKNVKILVYAHIFYIFSTPEIIEYLKNLEKYQYDLVITVPREEKFQIIIDQIKAFKPDCKIIKCQNRGYDIGPFIEMLKQTDINKYDIFFKLQSKSTPNQTCFIYNQIFKNRDWFEYLFEGVLGPFKVHKNIEKLSENNNIGIIAARNLIIKDPIHKEHFTKKQLEKHNLKIKNNYIFVAGTVYAERISLLKKIKKLNLSIKDFEPTEKGYFSFAHALERYIVANIGNNYIIYGNDVCKLKQLCWKKTNKKIQNITGIRLIKDKRIQLSDDFVLRYIEPTLIKEYKIENIKIGDINKQLDGKTYKLEECYPLLLLNGKIEEYIKKCLQYRRTDYMDLSKKEFEKTVKKECVKKYKKLIKSIDKNGYSSNNYIVVNQNNSIIDGQHRACYLLHKYGKDLNIKVLKIYEHQTKLENIKMFFNKIK